MSKILSFLVLNFSLYTKLNFTLIYIKNIKELNFECLKFHCFAALAFSSVGITFSDFSRKIARSRKKILIKPIAPGKCFYYKFCLKHYFYDHGFVHSRYAELNLEVQHGRAEEFHPELKTKYPKIGYFCRNDGTSYKFNKNIIFTQERHILFLLVARL